MKQTIVLIILLFALSNCNTDLAQYKDETKIVHSSDKVVNKVDQSKDFFNRNDSIQYRISVNKTSYKPNELIKVTIVAKNISDHTIKIWIDGGDYPTGTDLGLLNSRGTSMVEEYWAFVSSKSYSEEEVELLKTTIKSNHEFKKEYTLQSIIQLNEDLTAGIYTLRYNNSLPCNFEIK